MYTMCCKVYIPPYWLKHFNLEKAAKSVIGKTFITHLSVLPICFFVKCYVTKVANHCLSHNSVYP